MGANAPGAAAHSVARLWRADRVDLQRELYVRLRHDRAHELPGTQLVHDVAVNTRQGERRSSVRRAVAALPGAGRGKVGCRGCRCGRGHTVGAAQTLIEGSAVTDAVGRCGRGAAASGG